MSLSCDHTGPRSQRVPPCTHCTCAPTLFWLDSEADAPDGTIAPARQVIDADAPGPWERILTLLAMAAVAALSVFIVVGTASYAWHRWGDALVRAFWAAAARVF